MTLGMFEWDLENADFASKFGFVWTAIMSSITTVWSKEPTILIYEVGVDHEGEMQEFNKVFKKIDTVVITSLTAEHLVGFGDSPKKTELKLPENYTNWQNVPKNEESVYWEQLALLQNTKNYYLPITNGLDYTGLYYNLQKLEKLKVIRTSTGQLQVGDFVLSDRFYFPLSFAKTIDIAWQFAQKEAMPKEDFQAVLDNLTLPNGRFGLFEGVNNCKIVDGSYNSDPASLDIFLREARKLNSSQIWVLGEMRELGQSATKEHQKIIDQITENDNVILLGNEWNQCILPKYILKFRKVGEIVAYFKADPPQNKWIFIKGSQNTIFLEILVEKLLKNQTDTQYLARNKPEWQEIRRQWQQNP
jgi:UDP-N-acetylmuramyl pentapeptide synthase